MSRTEWVHATLIAGGLSVEHADRVMAEVRAELAAETDRLRAELAATVKAKQENDERFQLEAAAQRDRAEKAEARVAELERPAIEAERAEVRQSYMELSAQAREDRDHEGAFNVDCNLREREQQWAREDAAKGGA